MWLLDVNAWGNSKLDPPQGRGLEPPCEIEGCLQTRQSYIEQLITGLGGTLHKTPQATGNSEDSGNLAFLGPNNPPQARALGCWLAKNSERKKSEFFLSLPHYLLIAKVLCQCRATSVQTPLPAVCMP